MKRCFIISPIAQEDSTIRDHADYVFYFIIKPALDEHNIDAIRSDHLSEPGKISDQMFREILNDDLCIAVLTGHNPNVFYELAIAQSAARPFILLMEKGGILPFDIHDLRVVYYDLKPRTLFEKVYAKQLSDHVKSLDAMNWRVPSPLGSSSHLLSLKYSLYIGPPIVTALNPQHLMSRIEWDNDHCFLVSAGIKEKISLMPSISGQTFEVELEPRTVEKIKNQPIELTLKDKKGNAWKVRHFYLLRSLQSLSFVESPEKIASDYGDEEQ